MTPSEALAEARRRIAEARECNLHWLDLGDLGLEEIPREIGELSGLKALALGKSTLREGPNGFEWEWDNTRPSPRLTSVEPLRGLVGLSSLNLDGCGQLTSVEPLRGLVGLSSLNLYGCEQLTSVEPLRGLVGLSSLNLDGCGQLTSVEPLRGLVGLSSLNLYGCEQLTSVEPLRGLVELSSLNLRGCQQLTSVEPLRGLVELSSLNLRGCQQLTSVEPLRGLVGLSSLSLSWCKQLTSVEPLRGLVGLSSLNLWGCGQLTSVEPLRGLVELSSLNLRGCQQLTSVEPLRGLVGLTELDLSRCGQLTSVEPLRGLVGLSSLNLSRCGQLTSVEPLRGLVGLTEFDLSWCEQLTSVEPLRGLVGLSSLDLSRCQQLKEFAPIRPLLDHLSELKLHACSFDDLDPALCGARDENVFAKVRAHFADAEFQAVDDAELKLFLLGNGSVGKTQLRRRLCGLDFDESIPSTHGVEVERFFLSVATNQAVHLNIWDFGGQDVYHGTHALFLQKHALYVILWQPEKEFGTVNDHGIVMRNRPLAYWLDFVRSVAGTDAPVLIVESQFDDPTAVPATPDVDLSDFKRCPEVQASAKEPDGLERLMPELKRSVRYLLKQRPILTIGAGRVRVRDQLRAWLAAGQFRTLPWQRFVELCLAGQGDVSSPHALADFLHQTGFLFYDPKLFHGEIILDKGWALEAIYAVFHRQKVVEQLRRRGGRFTREDLGFWLWDHKEYSIADQERFVSMMLSCGICFRTRKLSGEHERPEVWEFAAPDHLPTLAEFQKSNPNLELPDPTTASVAASVPFRFLHDGLLRSLLARIGEVGGNAPDYWRYGCYFRVQDPDVRVRFDSMTTPDGPSAAGTVTFSAWGEQGRELIEKLLAEVQRLSPGQPVQPVWTNRAADDDTPRPGSAGQRAAEDRLQEPSHPPALDGLAIEDRRVFISYAWGERGDAGLQHDAFVDRLCQAVQSWGFDLICDRRDRYQMQPGECIRKFMEKGARAPRVLLLLNRKYLESKFCIFELDEVFRCSYRERDFCERIIPATLPGAEIFTIKDRAIASRYWKQQAAELAPFEPEMGDTDRAEFRRMESWARGLSDILAEIANMLHPVGHEAIEADGFRMLRQMLERGRNLE